MFPTHIRKPLFVAVLPHSPAPCASEPPIKQPHENTLYKHPIKYTHNNSAASNPIKTTHCTCAASLARNVGFALWRQSPEKIASFLRLISNTLYDAISYVRKVRIHKNKSREHIDTRSDDICNEASHFPDGNSVSTDPATVAQPHPKADRSVQSTEGVSLNKHTTCKLSR